MIEGVLFWRQDWENDPSYAIMVPHEYESRAALGTPPACTERGKLPVDINAITRARFWSKVNRQSGHFWNGSECWEWTASTDRTGYGHLSVAGKLRQAHRISFVLAHGPIPDELKILHHCDNRLCVRDEHLFGGDQHSNMADAAQKGRLRGFVLRCGEAQHAAALTDEIVRTILGEYSGARGQVRAFAARYGVTRRTIQLVLRGKTWRHIPRR
jgi:hypothetical protein